MIRRTVLLSTIFIISCLSLVTCRSNVDQLTDIDKILRQTDFRTIAVTDTLTVRSPYGPGTTDDILKMLTQELKGVCKLLGVSIKNPLLVSLDHADSQSTGNTIVISEIMNPTREGVRGTARTGGSFIQIYVPRPHPLITMYSLKSLRDVARHELGHIAYFRSGFFGKTWLIEGFAEYVRTMEMDDKWNLAPPPFPPAELYLAGLKINDHSMLSVLNWPSKLKDKEKNRALYHLSHSLFRFLLLPYKDKPLLDAVKRITELSREELLAQENKWKSWVLGLDFLAQIKEGVAADDPEARKIASSLMPWLAEHGYSKVLSPSMDKIAFEFLKDPDTSCYASELLIEYRYNDLDKKDVDELAAFEHPYVMLTGNALKARRGEKYDSAVCEAAYNHLSSNEKNSFHGFKKYLFPVQQY